MSHRIIWPNIDGTCFIGFVIYSCQKSPITSTIHNIIIQRINSNMRTFSSCSFFPITFRNKSIRISMRNSNGRIVLLCSINSIRKMIVRRQSVKLSCWLIHIGTPIFASIKGNLSTSIITNNHSLIIFRRNPQIMMISMRSIVRFVCFSTISGFMIIDIQHI